MHGLFATEIENKTLAAWTQDCKRGVPEDGAHILVLLLHECVVAHLDVCDLVRTRLSFRINVVKRTRVGHVGGRVNDALSF